MSAETIIEINDEREANYWARLDTIWPQMIAQWKSQSGLWLISPSNYLFHTECLWAVDPMLRHPQAPQKLLGRVHADFEGIRFVLISHLHADHYNLQFLQAIGRAGMTILVPHWLREEDQQALRDTGAQVILMHEGAHYQLDEITIDVYKGYHYDYNRPDFGVPSLAFGVQTMQKTLLFPGDVRDYEHCCLPAPCDVLFSHVWLGRGRALLPKEETLLACYAQFVRSLAPRHVFLSHLYDRMGRTQTDTWTSRHAEWAREALQTHGMQITAPVPGERYRL